MGIHSEFESQLHSLASLRKPALTNMGTLLTIMGRMPGLYPEFTGATRRLRSRCWLAEQRFVCLQEAIAATNTALALYSGEHELV